MQTIGRMVELLKRQIKADGFNIGLNLGRVAGAGVPGHLHWHLVPRWHGDTNFMPVVADVNVIPQSLDALLTLLQRRASVGPNDNRSRDRRPSPPSRWKPAAVRLR